MINPRQSAGAYSFLRLHKDEVDSGYETKGCGGVVPVQLLMLEDEISNHRKHHQRDTLLDDLQLNEVERPAVVHEADAVGRHLTAILEEGNHPREGNHEIEWPVGRDARLLEAQMAIPGEGHKHVAHDKQQDCINTVCHTSFILNLAANLQNLF